MSLLDQYRSTPENRAKEKSLLERYKHKLPQESSQPQEQFAEEGENDLERNIERNIAQQTSRIGETVLGFPGDIHSFAKYIFGSEGETPLPTSQSLREKSEKYSQGYTKPQNEFEERMGEVQQDIASFMLPGSGKYNLVRNIGIPIVANLAKEGIKYAGGEKMGDAAKIGTMVALDLMHLKGGGAKKFAGDLFNESEKLIPKGATLKSSKLPKSLANLEKSFESGGSRPSTEKALKKIGEMQSKLKNGEIEVQELIDFRKAINEIKTEIGGYEVQIPKPIKKKISANLDLVKKEVIEGLNEYGQTSNPEFLKLNKAANEAYGAYEASDKMATFIKKHVTTKNPALKTILGLGGVVKFPGIAAKAALGAPAIYAGYEGYKILHQVIQSPTLRKFYGNILKGAAVGNASQVARNSKALEKQLDKE
jgi:hypothetical protein